MDNADLKTALSNIKMAREELKALQESEDKSRVAESGEVVDDISDEDLERPDRSTNLLEGTQTMMHSLGAMQRTAEETLHSLEPANKKAKIATDSGGGGGDAAMKTPIVAAPFHRPG